MIWNSEDIGIFLFTISKAEYSKKENNTQFETSRN